MAQFAGSRSEFMTSDLGLNDIEYQRKGGCFLSHKKSALIIFLFVIAVVVAGFIGAILGSLSRDETLNLAEGYGGAEDDSPSKFSVSPSIIPNQYTVELTPILEDNKVTKLKGRVLIHFRNNATDPLYELVLNAKNITFSDYKLLSLDPPKKRQEEHTRRKREDGKEDTVASTDVAGNLTEANVTTPETPDSTGTVVNGNGDSSAGNDTSVPALDSDSIDVVNMTSPESPNTNDTSDVSGNATVNDVQDVHLGNVTAAIYETPVSTTSIPKVPDVVIQKVKPPTHPDEVVVAVTFPPIEVPTGATEIQVQRTETDDVHGVHAIYLDAPLGRGAYSIEINYETSVDGHAAYANSYKDGEHDRWLLATRLKPIHARCLFPGFDNVKLKARFSLSVARPKEMTILANMPLKSWNDIPNNWVMDNFEETPLLSPHNLAFIETNLQPVGETSLGDSKQTIKVWGKSSKKAETNYVMDKTGQVTQHFIDFFDNDYPLPKMDVVGMPGMVVDGSGSMGLVSIKESLFYITDKTPLITKEHALKNVIRLVGEQWLGGLVNMQNWTDAWVMEGSLTYLQQLVADKIDPTFDSLNSFVAFVQHGALELDGGALVRSLLAEVKPAYLDFTHSDAVYGKGACLIRMLHSVISDAAFRSGYQKFVSRWSNVNADIHGFWDAMSKEAKNLPEGLTLAEVMTPWVVQSGVPIVTVTRNYDTDTAVIRQDEFAFDKSWRTNQQLWHIPLTYVADGDDWSAPSKSWLKQEREITLDHVGKAVEKTWVLFNINETGYYRVNYDEDNWKLLTAALNSSHENFPPSTRASLVDDALSVARAGLTNYNISLDLIRYLSEKERHSAPWVVMLRHMTRLNNVLYNTLTYSSFQKFMVKFISPLYDEVGSKIEEGSQLTLTAIKWACMVDHQACLDQANHMFSELVKSSNEENPIPPYLRKTFYCTVARYGSTKEWNYLFNKTIITTDREEKNRLLSSLPCFRMPWILQTLLNEVLHGNRFGSEEIPILLRAFRNNPAATELAYKFLRQNWNEIIQRFSSSYPIMKSLLIGSTRGILDERSFKDRFREEEQTKSKIVGHALAVGATEAAASYSWLVYLPTIHKWLESYNELTS